MRMWSFYFLLPRICRNGEISVALDEDCLLGKGYTCTIGPHVNLMCGKGSVCITTKTSSNVLDYPHLGVCKKIEKGSKFIISFFKYFIYI